MRTASACDLCTLSPVVALVPEGEYGKVDAEATTWPEGTAFRCVEHQHDLPHVDGGRGHLFHVPRRA